MKGEPDHEEDLFPIDVIAPDLAKKSVEPCVAFRYRENDLIRAGHTRTFDKENLNILMLGQALEQHASMGLHSSPAMFYSKGYNGNLLRSHCGVSSGSYTSPCSTHWTS